MNSTPLSAEKVNCTGTSELRCKTREGGVSRIGELHKVAWKPLTFYILRCSRYDTPGIEKCSALFSSCCVLKAMKRVHCGSESGLVGRLHFVAEIYKIWSVASSWIHNSIYQTIYRSVTFILWSNLHILQDSHWICRKLNVFRQLQTKIPPQILEPTVGLKSTGKV